MRKRTQLLIVLSVALIAGTICVSFFLTPSRQERGFYTEVAALPPSQNTPSTKLQSLSGFEKICVLPPYAIQGMDQESRLKTIFGGINYAPVLSDIEQHKNDDGTWAFYLVRQQEVVQTLHIRANFLYKSDRFKSACYEPASLCLRRNDDNAALKNEVLRLTQCE